MSDLYDLPDGWEWKILSDCVTNPKKDIVDGPFGSNLKATEYIDSGIPIIRLQNIQRFEFIDKDIKFISKEKEEQLKRHTFISGDIVITKLGDPLGKSCVVPRYLEKGVIVADVIRVRVNEDKTNKSYIEYVLNSQLAIKQFSDNSKGATRQRVKLTMVRALNIPLPPFSEQKRIVSKLDNLFEKIDKAIALHQKNINEANVFMGSVLNDVFGEMEERYEKKSIGSFSKVGTGVTPLKSRNDYYDNGKLNWITSKATNSDFVYGSGQLITNIALVECRLKLYPIGTLIVALYGQGKTRGQVSELMIETTTNQALATIIVDENDSYNKYLKYFLKKSYLDLRDKASGGTQPNLNLTIIKETELPLPPLHIQQKVVKYLDEVSEKIEKVKSIQKEKMNNLKDLKASILDKAFRGEL